MVSFNQYPVFGANQVLRHDHLNDLINYLEEQTRVSRVKLHGIGVVCGFDIAQGEALDGNGIDRLALLVGKGVGITSKGYLAVSAAQSFTGFKPYTVEQEFSRLENDIRDDQPYTSRIRLYRELADVYPFFEDGPDQLLDLFELVPDLAEDDEAQPLSEGFLENKVLILYVKQDLQSLKNCDTNDCNDVGAKLEMHLRFLLADRGVAEDIMGRERATEGNNHRPIHLSDHGKYTLPDAVEITLPKINVYKNAVQTFTNLAQQYATNVKIALEQMEKSILQSLEAYDYMLDSIYPSDAGDIFQQLFQTIQQNLQDERNAQNPSIQNYYDFAAHLIDAYKEFSKAAAQYQGICSPNMTHFPKHLFLGILSDLDLDLSETFEPRPSFIQTGSGRFPFEESTPQYRHPFIPANQLDQQHKMKEEVQALHYRLLVMLRTFAQQSNVFEQVETMRIVPSQSRVYPLSSRAIPHYLPVPVAQDDDPMLRIWSNAKTKANQLHLVHSYYRIDNQNHPLQYRQCETDFYRIAGHLNAELSGTLSTLHNERRRLGLDFSIEVVQMSTQLDRIESIGQSVTLFNNFSRQHPGLEHLGGVPKGGTFILAFQRINGRDRIMADFALPYSINHAQSQGYVLQQCLYKWISSAKYLRNIVRPKYGISRLDRHYTLIVSKYVVEGVDILGKRNKRIRISIRDMKYEGMRAIVNGINRAFPTGLVFDTGKAEDQIAVKRYAGQTFELEIKEGQSADTYYFNETGRIKLDKRGSLFLAGRRGSFLKEADCNFIPPPYHPINYEVLHQSLHPNQYYTFRQMTNRDWMNLGRYKGERVITDLLDGRLSSILGKLDAIRADVLTLEPKARVYLVGSWADGTYLSNNDDDNPDDLALIREKILGAAVGSDIEIMVEMPDDKTISKAAVASNVKTYYGDQKVNVTVGKPKAGASRVEIIDRRS